MTVESPVIGLQHESAAAMMADYEKWKANPPAFEGKPTITAEEYKLVQQLVVERFASEVAASNLPSSTAILNEQDVQIAHNIITALHDIEAELIPDEKRRPLNDSTLEHFQQVEAFTEVIASEANNKNPGLGLDVNRLKVKGALHDTGRSGTHNPVLHGASGRDTLKQLGISADIRRTTLAHLEAGVGPYIYGVTPESWESISGNPEAFDKAIAELPIEEVIIAIADIGKKGIQQPDGSFVNTIADPVDGLVPSAKRRLKTTEGEPSDELLQSLASTDAETRSSAMTALKSLGASETDVNKMAMYFGWMTGLKSRVETELGIVFEGENGVIAKAQERFEQLRKNY